MNSNLKRKIERLEKAVSIGCDDPRAYSYPNTFAELSMMTTMVEKGEEQKWRQFLRTRRSEPCPQFWDWVDQQVEQLRRGEVKNRTDIDYAEPM